MSAFRRRASAFFAASERLIGCVRAKMVTNKYEIFAIFFFVKCLEKIKIYGTNENIFNINKDRNILQINRDKNNVYEGVSIFVLFLQKA